jgi:CRP-like cAMP-binding protein
MPSPKLRLLFEKGQTLIFPKDQVIVGNSLEPEGVYYIHSGYIKVYSLSDEGDEYIHIIFGHGEIFPMIWAYLDIASTSLFYETLVETKLYRISRPLFNAYIKTDLSLAYAASVQLAQQFRILTDRIDNLEYKKASERVAYRLLFLAARFGNKENGYITIDLPITHEIFANTINLVRESVSREIEILVREKIIQKVHHHIRILDVERLAGRLSRPVNLSNWNLL